MKIAAIRPVKLTRALKAGVELKSFTFSRTWTSPRTILHLAAVNIALVNVQYLTADDDLAWEDLFIVLRVLPHLYVATRTLLEKRIASLNGTDCSQTQSAADRGGRISCLMIGRPNRVPSIHMDTNTVSHPDYPRVDYSRASSERSPFPDALLLDPIDDKKEKEVRQDVSDMVICA